MHDHGRPCFARLLAPLALIAVAVVVAGDGARIGRRRRRQRRQEREHRRPAHRDGAHHHCRATSRRVRATYTVKAGDTLGADRREDRRDGRAAAGAQPRARPAEPGRRARRSSCASEARAPHARCWPLALLAAAGGPRRRGGASARRSRAREAAIVVDGRDGDGDVRQATPTQSAQIASTTKLMTALLTLEQRAAAATSSRAPAYHAAAGGVAASTCAPGERMTRARPARGAAARERERRRGDARRGRLPARARPSWRR